MGEAFSITTVSLDGGGRIGICRLPGLSGDLDSDIGAIVQWRPAIVVSMTEQAEMDRCGSGNLGAALANAAIDWFHLPIRDYGELAAEGKAAWPGLAMRLHEVLDGGGAVLLHCRGGIGRSGMIALRILVERGEEAGRALERLRSARPGAVETRAQFLWASNGAAEGFADDPGEIG